MFQIRRHRHNDNTTLWLHSKIWHENEQNMTWKWTNSVIAESKTWQNGQLSKQFLIHIDKIYSNSWYQISSECFAAWHLSEAADQVQQEQFYTVKYGSLIYVDVLLLLVIIVPNVHYTITKYHKLHISTHSSPDGNMPYMVGMATVTADMQYGCTVQIAQLVYLLTY